MHRVKCWKFSPIGLQYSLRFVAWALKGVYSLRSTGQICPEGRHLRNKSRRMSSYARSRNRTAWLSYITDLLAMSPLESMLSDPTPLCVAFMANSIVSPVAAIGIT